MHDIIVKKYDNSIKRVFHFDRLVKTTSEYLQFQSDNQLLISENGKKKIIPYRTDFFLYPEKWFNIFMFYESDDKFYDAFCNFAMPPIISEQEMSFVDLDLDVIVKPDSSIAVEDKDEFEERSIIWHYPSEFRSEANKAIREISSLVEKRLHPFHNL
jgi:protein associated with RNAse G/E